MWSGSVGMDGIVFVEMRLHALGVYLFAEWAS